MANTFFRFKEFTVNQDKCAMKVTTDGCLFGAWVAERLKDSNEDRLLDIGTGTGLLALMMAQRTVLQIDALEIEASAAQQAAQNVSESPWMDRINIIQKDVRGWQSERKYPLIISNPPFYENEWQSGHSGKDTAHHSTRLTVLELLDAIASLLSENGRFFLLWPYKRWKQLEPLLTRQGYFVQNIVEVHQTPEHAAFRIMAEFSTVKSEPVISQLIIRDQQNQYTPEFTELLKPYYLNL
jgi:tRNA1Val (adenine37-N6)-methyltransferase